MNIKKQYAELYALLEANRNKKINTLMPELIELMSAKQSAKNFLVNDEGQVTHVFCYYHKQWEDIAVAEYGSKASSASGLNSMCKEGVSAWTKQQKHIKALSTEALNLVTSGELEPAKITEYIETKTQELKTIIPRADEHIAEL